jgi:hypothetical protein
MAGLLARFISEMPRIMDYSTPPSLPLIQAALFALTWAKMRHLCGLLTILHREAASAAVHKVTLFSLEK